MPWYLWVICIVTAAVAAVAAVAGTIVIFGLEAFRSIVNSATGRDRAPGDEHDGDDAA